MHFARTLNKQRALQNDHENGSGGIMHRMLGFEKLVLRRAHHLMNTETSAL